MRKREEKGEIQGCFGNPQPGREGGSGHPERQSHGDAELKETGFGHEERALGLPVKNKGCTNQD